MDFDLVEVLRRAIKYIVEGLMVGFVCYLVANTRGGRARLDMEDIIMIGLTASAVYAILDMFSPGIAVAARFGSGATIGAGLVGGVPMM